APGARGGQRPALWGGAAPGGSVRAVPLHGPAPERALGRPKPLGGPPLTADRPRDAGGPDRRPGGALCPARLASRRVGRGGPRPLPLPAPKDPGRLRPPPPPR